MRYKAEIQDIFNKLQLSEFNEQTKSIIIQHNLQGLYRLVFEVQDDDLELAYRSTSLWNSILLEELSALKAHLSEDLQIVLLKGASLYSHKIYSDMGSRPMSDIDLYCEDSNALGALLQKNGFTESVSKRWLGDSFKRDFVKGEAGLQNQIAFEIHNKLFWSQKTKFKVRCTSPQPGSFCSFSLEEELFLLLTHYIYLDTFQKLLQWFDIILFLTQYSQQIDFKELKNIFSQNEMMNTYFLFVSALRKFDFECAINSDDSHWDFDFDMKHFVSMSKTQYIKYKWLVHDSKRAGCHYFFRRALMY